MNQPMRDGHGPNTQHTTTPHPSKPDGSASARGAGTTKSILFASGWAQSVLTFGI